MTNLQRATLSGSFWVAISVLFAAVVQLAQLASVARVLEPTQVGVVAASLVILALADTIANMGIANSIIQRQNASRDELSSLYWLNVLVGIVIAVALYVSAPLFEWFFRMPELTALVHVIALGFIFSPHGQVPRGILERRMAFRSVAVIEMVGAATILAATLVLLFLGAGPVAVAAAYAFSVSLKALLFVYASRREFFPRFHFRLVETTRFLSFGLITSLDMIVSFFAANIGSFAVGRLVSPTALGGYNLAFTYAVNTPARLNGVVTRVAFPAMSQIQSDRSRQARAIRRVIETVTIVNAPLLVTLAIVALPFTEVFFGPNWLWVAALIQVLSGVGLTRAMGNPMGAILMALNRMGVGLIVNVIKSSVHIAVVIFGAIWGGVFGAAWAAVIMGVVTLATNVVLLKTLAGIPARTGILDHVRPLLYSIPLAIVGVGMMWVTSWLGMIPLVTLIVVCAACGVTYLCTLMVTRHFLVQTLTAFLRPSSGSSV
ncbi:MAG TPA: MOP flippase family protein [Microbacterium sp.]|nr:MOP flippase family protein [Microbacterium sp.]